MPDKVLLFDTETTGKADFKRPLTDPLQPRLVQLACLLTEGLDELACINVVITPSFSIPDDVARVHGITTKKAVETGVGLHNALVLFQDLAVHADWFVAHNIDFDSFVLKSEFVRFGLPDPFVERPLFCTMRNSTDVCNVPGPYGPKWPRLSEVYQFAFGETLEHAHNALHDLRATWRVYKWLKDKLVERSLA